MSSTRFSYLPLIAMLAVPFSTQCSNSDTTPGIPTGSGGSSGGSGGSRSGGSGGSRSGGSSESGGSSSGGSTGSGGSSSGGSTGSGGSSGTGGSSGSGGSTSGADGSVSETGTPGDDGGTTPEVPEAPLCLNTKVAEGKDGLIDDFEDGDANILRKEGREGDWWAVPGPKTVLTGVPATGGAPIPIAAGKARPGKAIQFKGTLSGADNWLGNLDAKLIGSTDCFSAAPYGGIEFWIRGTAGMKVSVFMKDAAVRALGPGNGYWYEDIAVTDAWTKKTVRFSSLLPQLLQLASFDKTKVASMGFKPTLGANVTTYPQTFEFLIDDVALVP